jgi:hypothetical protein
MSVTPTTHLSGFQNTGALQQLYLITKQLLFRRADKLNKSALYKRLAIDRRLPKPGVTGLIPPTHWRLRSNP